MKEKLKSFIDKKTTKQQELQHIMKTIDDVDLDITTTNISKQLGMFGSKIVGALFLIIGIILLMASIGVLIYPEVITDYTDVIKTPHEIAKAKYDSYTTALNLRGDEGIFFFDTLKQEAMKDQYDMLRLLALFSLIISSFILFQRRHMQMLRKRSKQILEANKIIQEFIIAYKEFIVDGEKDLEELEKIVGEDFSE